MFLLGPLCFLPLVGIALVVAFAYDRRAGFLALGCVVTLLGTGALIVTIGERGFGNVFLGMLCSMLLLATGITVLTRATQALKRPGKGAGTGPGIDRMAKDAWTALAAQLRQAAAGLGIEMPARDPQTPLTVLPAPGPRHCPDCGAELPANAPEGLCPRCLLGSGLAGPSPTPPPASPRGTTPYPSPFTAPEPAELAAHFPQLEILELIGQGGMGAVYKARQTKLDRLVALKVLPSEWGKDPAFAERFAREARTLARLNHPHIVAVHDFGESGGLYYLVMEYVDGANLREAMRAGPLPPEQALAVVPQVCDALQYAHEEGVVHRDVKPENILLDKRGRVKIADFGLAKLLNRPRAEFTLTGSRQVMGTLDYMAPEQRLRPLEIDHRADIYSLGVVLYEMLTGELPLGHFAPPSERAGVDARLDEVVLRALKTDPAQRYQSISAVKTDVESIAGGRAPAAAPGPDDDWRRVRAAALQQVRGPATGLLLAGLLAPVAAALFLLAWVVIGYPSWLNDGTLVSLMRRMPPEESGPLVGMLFASLISGGILVAGAWKVRKGEAYELAFISCIVAVSGLTGPAFLLSLPMGLWALLVLCKRQVRAGFGPVVPPGARRAGRATPALTPGPTGPARGKVRSFVNSVLAMFVSRPGKGYPEKEDRLAERP